ncbi:signal peptide containing protein [Theileria equi strain WA]|uniref:Signal peptide containing protein n=1 Tax=Theileria equi strain WA TaxID=1537102 RepID=L1LBB8_THEEQ|nr:signal peptide containing protein [Theileria equi strain WA]EKX72727.1 signal peptide containing protein [Theileria equi strain WA]|eukprot:XP_004832179.1 signal peptide containing protein [Theileria equi strain WA]
MKKCVSSSIIALFTLFISTGESRNVVPLRPPSGDYLLIHDSRRFCEGSTILDADDEIKVEDALDKCDSIEQCSFFCQTRDKAYSRAAVLGKPRRVSKTGNTIPRSSVSWMCSGNGWNGLFVKKGWMTGVKGDEIRKISKDYEFGMNKTAECQGLIDVVKGFGVKESVMRCKRLEECSFFTMSFEVKDNSVAFETVTNFCKGEPRNILVKDGNLLAQKITGERQGIVNEAKTTPMRHIRPSFYFGGPITNDHYYDDMSAGSLVPATKL